MKIATWNVNGIRARHQQFADWLAAEQPDVVCLQEIQASRAQTLEAVSGMMNLVMMPMWLCSGVFFSYERFPDALKPLIRALPLTALNDSLRSVMNDAATLGSVIPNVAILLAWGLASFAVGLRIFRWQ